MCVRACVCMCSAPFEKKGAKKGSAANCGFLFMITLSSFVLRGAAIATDGGGGVRV